MPTRCAVRLATGPRGELIEKWPAPRNSARSDPRTQQSA
jgi:hypothetical protein